MFWLNAFLSARDGCLVSIFMSAAAIKLVSQSQSSCSAQQLTRVNADLLKFLLEDLSEVLCSQVVVRAILHDRIDELSQFCCKFPPFAFCTYWSQTYLIVRHAVVPHKHHIVLKLQRVVVLATVHLCLQNGALSKSDAPNHAKTTYLDCAQIHGILDHLGVVMKSPLLPAYRFQKRACKVGALSVKLVDTCRRLKQSRVCFAPASLWFRKKVRIFWHCTRNKMHIFVNWLPLDACAYLRQSLTFVYAAGGSNTAVGSHYALSKKLARQFPQQTVKTM